MNHHPARERVYLAVEHLASSNNDIVDRLETVYVSHLIPIREADFKSNRAKELFMGVMKPLREEKMVNGKLNSLSEDEAKQIAKDIVSLLIWIDHFNDED